MRPIVLLSLFALAAPVRALPLWQDTGRPPASRAAALERAMTDAERLSLIHGIWPVPWAHPGPLPTGAIPGAGYVPGVPRLGVPALTETDASLGVANPSDVRPGDVATALPSGLAMAATFDPGMAFAGGAMVAGEARAKGFNVLLTGGINLARDPRGGRNFEYMGEDPLLAGMMGGAAIRGTQSRHVLATVKHFALNDSETHRNFSNSLMSGQAMRETDLLAFEIAIEQGRPGAAMCGYNLVEGVYACGNGPLLNGVLKGDWHFPGFVMSDWGAVKATDFALNGLDQQSAEESDAKPWLAPPLAANQIPRARLSDMVRRILTGQIAAGLYDHPVTAGAPIDRRENAEISRRIATAGIVLLKNDGEILPLAKTGRTILVIGDYVEKGVLAGGGSSAVVAGADQPAAPMSKEGMFAQYVKQQYHPSPPLAAIRARAPQALVLFDNGRNAQEAARRAALADIVIVFGNQWMTEDSDAPNLDLPNGQDAMIAAVARANPRTVVVLQTGGPIAMPWADAVPAILEAWYSGQKGGDAMADILFGDANPSGRLPMTFPRSIAQTPRPAVLDGTDLAEGVRIDVRYPEGADVGYRWFARTGQTPLFPFGHGLSYTRYQYRDFALQAGKTLRATFTVTNTGARTGRDVPQLYLEAGPAGRMRRLLGFRPLTLQPGESRTVTLDVDDRLLSGFDLALHRWRRTGGTYRLALSHFAGDTALLAETRLSAQTRAP